jgi:hypothetical protein
MIAGRKNELLAPRDEGGPSRQRKLNVGRSLTKDNSVSHLSTAADAAHEHGLLSWRHGAAVPYKSWHKYTAHQGNVKRSFGIYCRFLMSTVIADEK